MTDISKLLSLSDSAFDAYAERVAIDELASTIRVAVHAKDAEAISFLSRLLSTRGADLEDKPIPSRFAARGLLALGPIGVSQLTNQLLNGRVRYRARVFEMLAVASRRQDLAGTSDPRVPDDLTDLALPPGTADAVRTALRDIAAEASVNANALRLVADFIWQSTVASSGQRDENNAAMPQALADVVALFADASIRLTSFLIDGFEALIARHAQEETYQQFLAANPVFLDPLAAAVIPKQRLGLEFATDFALRRHDGAWILVEIEKPSDPLFTRRDDFTSAFTHAFGQVLDFQHWVDANVAYAQKLMPGITNPRGLLVIGKREGLTERQSGKLRRFADNSARIDIVTYDDILRGVRHLYRSLRHDRQA